MRGPEHRVDLHYFRVWVSKVRRKLGAEPGDQGRIRTFQGIGYLLAEGRTSSNASDVGPAEPDKAVATPPA
jgi:DNA-binding winged helix-turn-helix (wHTH) protein